MFDPDLQAKQRLSRSLVCFAGTNWTSVQVEGETTNDVFECVANIGDQRGDLAKGHVEMTFKVPNPFYFIP
jgi:hypothetical protein